MFLVPHIQAQTCMTGRRLVWKWVSSRYQISHIRLFYHTWTPPISIILKNLLYVCVLSFVAANVVLWFRNLSLLFWQRWLDEQVSFGEMIACDNELVSLSRDSSICTDLRFTQTLKKRKFEPFVIPVIWLLLESFFLTAMQVLNLMTSLSYILSLTLYHTVIWFLETKIFIGFCTAVQRRRVVSLPVCRVKLWNSF